jgi:carboxyl-terminal processing protease
MGLGRDQKARRWLGCGGLTRRLGTFSIAFFVVACTSQGSEVTDGRDLSLANRLFGVGYQDISDIYIDDLTMADLAIAGLENLTSIEPNVEVKRTGNRLVLSIAGQQKANFVMPASNDASSWGKLTATALRVGRSQSTELESASPEEVYEAVFDGVLKELDNFSRYAGRDEARENRASRDGFGGIGVRIRLVDEGVKILSVMENTPAERSGLLDNDVITNIDDEATIGLSQREVVRRLRGPLRSKVELTVARAGETAALGISIVRAHIVPQTVKFARRGKAAVLKVSGFNQSTSLTLREKIKFATHEIGPDLTGFILDLRGNPGGLLDQAVAVSDLFIRQGRIVSTHGRHPDSHQYFDAEPDDVAREKPVVVLINGNSASASEIVASALQDSGRAVVVGSGSFGKGTVQTVLRLPNEGELTLTWARFHAPSGYALNGRGVLPDVCTTGNVEDAAEVLKRLRQGLLPIDRAARNRNVDEDDKAGIEKLRSYCPARQTDPDIDIEVAQRLLEEPELFARALTGKASETAQLGSDPTSAKTSHE